MCTSALHTLDLGQTLCSRQGLKLCGIIPICITSAMCSEMKEMNLCDLTWGCAPQQGPNWEKESPQGHTPAPPVFPSTTRVTAHPKSRFPEQTGLSHGPAWPGHDPSPQITQLQPSPEELCRGSSTGSMHDNQTQPQAQPCNAPFDQSAFQTEM